MFWEFKLFLIYFLYYIKKKMNNFKTKIALNGLKINLLNFIDFIFNF